MTKKPDEKPKLELVDSPPPDSIFDDIEALRRTTDLKVVRRVVQVNVSVGKPKNNIYFRCHPDPGMMLDAWIVPGNNGSDDFYYVTPVMKDYHVIAPRRRRVTIAVVYAWPAGVISLWPVPNPGETRIACWKSARVAFERSQAEWVQMVWDDDKRDYNVVTAEGINTEPLWPSDLNLSNLLKIGFAEKIIDTPEHPYVLHSAGLPNSFDRFQAIWQIDFEYRQDSNHLPVPVALFVKEQRTGTEIGPLTREQLLAMNRAPFDTGPDVLVTSYSIVAELSCFRVLGWPMPRNLLCSYFETCAVVNGQEIEGLMRRRPKLLEGCELFGLEHSSPARKKYMRDVILNNENYTAEQWREIADYNRDDVLDAIRLLETIAPAIDVRCALYRARYGIAVAAIEACGIPISVRHLSALQGNWQALRMFYIRRDDTFGLYDASGSFKENRFAALVDSKGWGYSWPRTETGRLALTGKVLGKQAKQYPVLKPLQHLRDSIAELRLGRVLNTIGADYRSRCAILPFWTNTGRNQPGGRDKVFLLSLPSWLHGLIAPPPGYGMALLDWKAQEIGIAAGLSGDPALTADFLAGDPHMGFAIRAGLAPPGATKNSHGDVRDMVKPISLGSQYGMSKYGAAAQSRKSLAWAAAALATHRHSYPVFTGWQQNTAAQAVFDRSIGSVFGWPMAVHEETKTRTLLNYPAQANGAECMRIAAIAAHEAGIQVCAPAHDAFWIMAPLAELDGTIAAMTEIMLKAGRAVAGITIPVDVSYVVKWPQCLGDVRKGKDKGHAMWVEVQELIGSGDLQTGEAAE